MSAHLIPVPENHGAIERPYAPAPHYLPPAEPEGQEGDPAQLVQRVWAALKRYKWLILAILVMGTATGIAATRLLKPKYEVRATIWITSETPLADSRSASGRPIRSNELLASAAWIELLRSFTIADQVVTQMRLFVQPEEARDSALFGDFEITDGMQPGTYQLEVDGRRARWTLSSRRGAMAEWTVIERGALGDSVGRAAGFAWQPPGEAFTPGQSLRFKVVTPREASVQLIRSIQYAMAKESNFLGVSLAGEDSRVTAATMNTWLREFVAKAADMKKRNLVEFSKTLQMQLAYAQDALHRAEFALERFRVETITLPKEGVAVVAGLELTTDPALAGFFEQKKRHEALKQDREALERFVEQARRGQIGPNAIASIPGVMERGRGEGISRSLTELSEKEAQLRAARQFYTDQHKTVQELRGQIEELRRRVIPDQAAEIAAQLRAEETVAARGISNTSVDLRRIPTRTIEEMRLTRNVEVAEELFTSLRKNYEEAKLAEASALPDVAILDTAVAPLEPTSNQAPRLLFLAVAGSLALGLALAVLLDRVDNRFRYPEQVSDELGLDIIGAVPTIRRPRSALDGEPARTQRVEAFRSIQLRLKMRDSHGEEEEHAQVVEAFRSIRLNLHHAFQGAGPITFTVTSAGAGDGKSFIASNLALSFADAGYQTVLVDGDVRRGGLHNTFSVESKPGLMEYLAGEAMREDVVRPSQHDNLSVVPTGAKRRQGPELLASREMSRFIEELRSHYDVVIVDSPPLGAGIDPFALGTVTGNILLVFRSGTTDRRMAKAKLHAMTRFPIRPLGAVLNGIQADGVYRYYSYLQGYGAIETGLPDGETRRLAPRVGEVHVGS